MSATMAAAHCRTAAVGAFTCAAAAAALRGLCARARSRGVPCSMPMPMAAPLWRWQCVAVDLPRPFAKGLPVPVPLPLQNHEKYFAKKPRNRSYFDSNPLYDFFNELNSECITPTTCQHCGNFLVSVRGDHFYRRFTSSCTIYPAVTLFHNSGTMVRALARSQNGTL